MGRKDAEGQFVRETCGLKLAGAGGNVVCVSPAGKLLGHLVGANGMQCDPKKAWEEWQKLPENERNPGAVSVGAMGPADPRLPKAASPPGGLILKQHYRMMAHDAKGELRHVVIEDFDHHKRLSTYYDPKAKRHYFEASPDFVWLTEPEWKSLLPVDPRVGGKLSVPAAITERLVRFHLVPDITFGESTGWQKKDVRAGEMTLTVEEVTPARLRLRLDGSARLGLDFETAQARSKNGGHSAHGYEPRLLGYIEYDVMKQCIDRFDLAALGDFYGTLYGDNRWLYRSGRTPLGVGFKLVSANDPAADRQVPPRSIRAGYFATGK